MTESSATFIVMRKLTEDLPGEHWYVFSCTTCQSEISDEWVERRWGHSEAIPPVSLHACPLSKNICSGPDGSQ